MVLGRLGGARECTGLATGLNGLVRSAFGLGCQSLGRQFRGEAKLFFVLLFVTGHLRRLERSTMIIDMNRPVTVTVSLLTSTSCHIVLLQ